MNPYHQEAHTSTSRERTVDSVHDKILREMIGLCHARFPIFREGTAISCPDGIQFLHQNCQHILELLHREFLTMMAYGKYPSHEEIRKFYEKHELRSTIEHSCNVQDIKWFTKKNILHVLHTYLFPDEVSSTKEYIQNFCFQLLNPSISTGDSTLHFLVECNLFRDYLPNLNTQNISGIDVLKGISNLFKNIVEMQLLQDTFLKGFIHKISPTSEDLWISPISPKKGATAFVLPASLRNKKENDIIYFNMLPNEVGILIPHVIENHIENYLHEQHTTLS